MKYLSLLFVVALFLLSCQENKNTNLQEQETKEVKTETEANFLKFGKEISPDGAIDAKGLVAKLNSADSVQIKLKSTVNAVCKKKGCWMTVPIDEKTEIRVRFKDYEFFVPKNSEGKNVIFEGWAYKYTTSIKELQHYALDGGASIEEIDAITEPEVGYTFMADGVLMN